MSHISDSQFQELLDGNLNDRQSKLFLSHILDCRICQKEWQTYLQLKKKLKQIPEIRLSEDFTDHVLAALPGRPFRFRIRKLIISISACGFLAVIVASYYFRASLKQAFLSNTGFQSPLLEFRSIFDSISQFILRIGGDQVIYFAVACLALFLIGVLDKKIIQPKTRGSLHLLNGIS